MAINSLDELKEAIKGSAQEADVLDFVVRQVEMEKSTGIDRHRKANKEAEGLRKSLTAIKDKLSDLGWEEDSDLEEFFDSLKKTKETAPESNKELKKLTKQLVELKSQLDAKTAAESELRGKTSKLRIKTKLGADISDKVWASEYVVDGLINSQKIGYDDDTDSVVWLDGETRIPYDQGLKRWLDSNQSLLKNSQKPGASSAGPQGGSAQGKLTIADLEKMSPDEAAKRMPEVRAALGLKN
jgi:hypothetical protein